MITLSERMKKILFLFFFIGFTVGTGYALYYFFFRPAQIVTPTEQIPGAEYTGELATAGARGEVTPGTPGDAGELPTAETTEETAAAFEPTTIVPGIDLIRNDVTQAVAPSEDGSTRFYSPQDGRFYRINADGTLTALSDRQFYNVETVSWAHTNDEVILEFPDGSNIFYDFDTKRQVSLPRHWEDFDFSYKDDSIVAKSIGVDQNNRFLISAQADGNELTALYHLGDNADRVLPSYSPNNQVIGFSKTGTPQADGVEEIYLLGKNHEDLKSLKVSGRGFIPNWSPNGKKLLYSVYHERDQYRPMLWVSDASGANIGQNRQKLNMITWADKCAWMDEVNIICAVPVNLPTGAGADPEAFSSVSDDIYHINLSNGISKKINTDLQIYPVTNPIISADKSKLLFTHAINGKLYQYDLNF